MVQRSSTCKLTVVKIIKTIPVWRLTLIFSTPKVYPSRHPTSTIGNSSFHIAIIHNFLLFFYSIVLEVPHHSTLTQIRPQILMNHILTGLTLFWTSVILISHKRLRLLTVMTNRLYHLTMLSLYANSSHNLGHAAPVSYLVVETMV